ncbi:MAG: OsmC family protein [Syntrophaceae bacterium]|nr:OsmC family protein [Syntrophaceae bacterium]
MAIHPFRAESVLGEGMAVENAARGFTVTADEPKTMRGTDTGMNPVEMLLCALGSCLCITARYLARPSGIDLQEFRVSMEGSLDPDGFIRGKEGVRSGYQEIRLNMTIRSSSPRDKVETFLDLVKARCPVSDSLLQGVPIRTGGEILEGEISR